MALDTLPAAMNIVNSQLSIAAFIHSILTCGDNMHSTPRHVQSHAHVSGDLPALAAFAAPVQLEETPAVSGRCLAVSIKIPQCACTHITALPACCFLLAVLFSPAPLASADGGGLGDSATALGAAIG